MAGLYIHIPYCKTRCAYCDFYSQVSQDGMKYYVNSLLFECQMRMSELHGELVRTIYIGGGTPSQLSIEDMNTLICGLSKMSLIVDVEEFTVEVNPDDVSVNYLSALRDMGINRVSMGIQSFNDGELKVIGRRHSAQQAEDAVHAIRKAGYDNFSIDLIYGLPLQSIASWTESVERAVNLDVPHLSAYCLSYEPGTPLWNMRERGVVKEVAEEDIIEMYKQLVSLMGKNDYKHYEISNFARPGKQSRHNSSYWNDVAYLGLGASAHSYDGEVRRWNVADISQYVKNINAGKTAFETEQLEWWEKYDETIMVRLRTNEGLNLNDVESRFGHHALQHIEQCAKPHIDKGLLVNTNGYLALSGEGVLFSDAVIRDLMWPV